MKPATKARAGQPRRGEAAEAAVAHYLRALGYEVVGQNLRLGYLELDVVALDGRVVVVVEVRARSASAFTSAFSSIDAKKRLRIRRAGERLWNRRFRSHGGVDRMRFDVASVTFGPSGPEIEYVRAAF